MALSYPTTAHIALALLIVKSKPADTLIEDHIESLQQIIVDRKRRVLVDDQQYIDGTLFWKQAYEKSEAEKVELQNRIFQFERQLNASHLPIVVEGSSPAKRKSELHINIRANTQSKRRKIEMKNPEQLTNSDAELESATLNSDHVTLLRALYNLRQTSMDVGLSASIIHNNISSNCHLMIRSLTIPPIQKCPQVGVRSALSIDDVCVLVRKAWSLMLDLMTKTTTSTIASKTVSPECVPNMVFIFQSMLGRLQQLCLDEGDRRITNQKRSRSNKSRKKISNMVSEAEEQEKACKAISITMAAMFNKLDLTIQSHVKLFEGLISSLLDHIGSALSLAIFGDVTKSKDIEKGICTPQGLLDVNHIGTETALETVRLASRYLINILHKATSILESAPTDPGDSTKNGNPNHDAETISRFKKRLQCTLLRGVFDEEDEVCEDALPRVQRPIDSDLAEVPNPVEYDKDRLLWFACQIWEHLGWDTLAAGD